MISFGQVENLPPKGSPRGPHSLQRSRRWPGRVGSGGRGQISPTFLLPGFHTLRRRRCSKSPSPYLEKSCARRGKGEGRLRWAPRGKRWGASSPSPAPVLSEHCEYRGKTGFGVEGLGWRETKAICGFFLGTWNSGVWLMRNPRISV